MAGGRKGALDVPEVRAGGPLMGEEACQGHLAESAPRPPHKRPRVLKLTGPAVLLCPEDSFGAVSHRGDSKVSSEKLVHPGLSPTNVRSQPRGSSCRWQPPRCCRSVLVFALDDVYM
ncbi:unnamed protein product [Pipistrellus nathusii]|uniref:Uncharacterized protein n=1 Tax=Pipistrellus nathusii TaxID=59473 RepID=A0ABP0A6T0_PIPNA